jgi:hypothetical protein
VAKLAAGGFLLTELRSVEAKINLHGLQMIFAHAAVQPRSTVSSIVPVNAEMRT